jgi:hypothetical protein
MQLSGIIAHPGTVQLISRETPEIRAFLPPFDSPRLYQPDLKFLAAKALSFARKRETPSGTFVKKSRDSCFRGNDSENLARESLNIHSRRTGLRRPSPQIIADAGFGVGGGDFA